MLGVGWGFGLCEVFFRWMGVLCVLGRLCGVGC